MPQSYRSSRIKQGNYLKYFMNKLNSAENFFTKLGTPRPEHQPTH